jgi:predicted permease
MDRLTNAARYALRQFRLSPVFTAAAVLTLALGIGGTTAIFTLIHAVMFRSLPVADPEQLYRIGDGNNCCVEGGPQDRWGMYSFPLVERLRTSAPEFEQLAAFQAGGQRMSVRREGVPEPARPLRTEYVTGNYFSTLGVGAFGGRVFTAADDTPASAPVVVLNHRTWETAYGADPGIIGSGFIVDGHPFMVVGVAPPGFFGETLRGDPPDLWIPLHQEPVIAGSGSLLRQSIPAWLRVIGRLRPGASVEGTAARLTGVLHQWLRFDAGYPANWMQDVIRALPRQTIRVVPAGAGVAQMKEEYSRSLQILLAVCGLVLLIACANVANLMLARAMARRTQTALRLAVGASRGQLVLQALVESVLLSVAGAAAGLLVAVGAARLLLALAFRNASFIPVSTWPSLPVLSFALALALLTGVAFGVAPAWFAARTDPVEALRGAGRSVGDQSSVTRHVLLVLQVTVSVVLIAGATMLAHSLGNLERQDFGFRVDGRAVVAVNRLPATYTQPQLATLYRQIEERLTRLPGVKGAGLALYNPLTSNWGEIVLVEGHPPPKISEQAAASWDRVSARYLQNLGVGLVRGRMFTDADNETSAPVAVVNEAFVRRFFKAEEDPLEQRFGLDLPDNAGTFRIVGIVKDAKFAGFALDQPARPMFYVPLAQNVAYQHELMAMIERMSHFIEGILLVTDLPSGTLEPMLTRALAEVDPNITITSVRTMREQVTLSFGQQRAVASLAGLFGVVALLLAAVGLYGVTALSVTRRTSEIGIRMSLGADRARILGLVLRSTLSRVFVGLALGVPLAIAAGRLISAQLYNVASWDPMALMAAAGALAASALVAAGIPALRAASIAPMSALRLE